MSEWKLGEWMEEGKHERREGSEWERKMKGGREGGREERKDSETVDSTGSIW